MRLSITLALLVPLCVSSCSSSQKDKDRPNVLFVVFDDLNDWQGCLSGHPQSLTPNIDRLAAKGRLFANAHCAGTMCCPSRASVITGLRPTTTGVYKNTDTPLDLYKSHKTINRHFKENGYFVAGAGKILHRFHFEENDWHEFVRRHKDKNSIGNREHPDSSMITRVSGNIGWGAFDTPDSLTFDGKTVDWVRERINRQHDKPFFLACGIFRPHIPWFNPEKYFELHPLASAQLPLVQENDLHDVPQSGKYIANSTSNLSLDTDVQTTGPNHEHELIVKRDLWPEAIQAYLASVSYADAQFGRLLDELEKSDYADNTIIVLWSDHGYHLGEKTHWRKATLWEEVTHVPLVIKAPGYSNTGNCNEAVSLIDIFPTLIEMCDLPTIDDLEGESLVPQLLDPTAPRSNPAISSLTPDFHSIRDDQFRYISYGNGEEELYDHEIDPEEWVNVAEKSDYAKVKRRLKSFLPKETQTPIKGVYNKKNEVLERKIKE